MSRENWKRIWEKKGAGGLAADADGDEDATLEKLIALDGYSAETARVAIEDWRSYTAAIAERMGIGPGDRLFEVGCGSGAFLYPFHRMGCVTDGIDYSAQLVRVAELAMPGGSFTAGDAGDIDPRRRYDVVVSNGVFPYFADLDYAHRVLSTMVAMSRRGVAVLDVTDAALEEEGLRVRRGAFSPGEYEKRFAGLDHLYYARSWFEEVAASFGLQCAIEPQFMPNYVGRSFRFNVYLTKGS